MGDLPGDRIEYTDLDDLFEEKTEESSQGLFDDFEDIEDISISSCVYEPVLVGLKDRKIETRLEKAFYPEHDREIILSSTDGGNPLTLPIEDLEYLAFVNRPLQIDTSKISDFSEVIETFRGNSFSIRVPEGQNFDIGLFGITIESADRYKYLFFASDNIRNHYQQRRLGQIIVEKRLLSEESIKNALSKQNRLRSLPLGAIIAKKTNILTRDIEATLQEAWRKSKAGHRPHSGEILIEAGLVPPQVVNQSLAYQKKIRGIKVGKLLVDMGVIDEEQVYRVLAEKFRKRYVNITAITPDSSALKLMPDKLIRKLKTVPLYFEKKKLVLATPFPDRAEITEILKKKLNCPFELVVSPLHQVIDAIANLPVRRD